MKVWEYISNLNDTNGLNKEQIAAVLRRRGHCPATFEYVHNLIGVHSMMRFCKPGCGVKCLEEYLDEVIKK